MVKRTNNDLQNIHIKLKIQEHEFHWNSGVNSGAQEGWVVPTPLVALFVLIYLQTRDKSFYELKKGGMQTFPSI